MANWEKKPKQIYIVTLQSKQTFAILKDPLHLLDWFHNILIISTEDIMVKIQLL